jgi:phosphoribosylaminoimidazolecarboxamide formyltransferase/IMP cyclohydrolase
MTELTVARALISVSDKRDIEILVNQLHQSGVDILSTGGTYKAIEAVGVPVTDVTQYTGFPEIMDGRVKTLHPKVHGGILGRRALDTELMKDHGIAPIDLVVVNLYPFEATVERDDCDRELAIENIDIGGPALVRSAAKNHGDVLVVVDPDDYVEVADRIAKGTIDLSFREKMAAKAFRHTAGYDAAIASYLSANERFPEVLNLKFELRDTMRYGENPHQQAAFYTEKNPPPGTVAALEQHQGKALSYNNVADTDAAIQCVNVFDDPACVIVKHANPCGVAIADSIGEAYAHAFATDPTSAFGGIIAFNRPLDMTTMAAVVANQFAEVVVAPSIAPGVIDEAQQRKNLRVLTTGPHENTRRGMEFKRVGGGILVQEADERCLDEAGIRIVTTRSPTDDERRDLEFAWRVAWFVKSNAIVFARAGCTVGVGAGQMSRVISARIAAMKAAEEGLVVVESVMASDAFFPFRDGIDAAAEVGISAVIQPGGSVRDDEVIEAANEHGMAMVFTGVRHFRH